MRAALLIALTLLAGCNGLYYPDPVDGMTITVNVHQDADAIYAACGSNAEACAIVKGLTCDIHLPERAGFTWDHEITHCFGRKDAPEVSQWPHYSAAAHTTRK